ncbi:flagellum-specific ATP synthase [Filomicrobium insigne]|uniref:Flagellum-specific ATP synthase n=2 Tax=Filomicrobium insigne TaxID=418854 RepID=A0A1H0NMV0_9HYPH|nr:flagellum-specific ATP synthase [Filomicrobium insigne]
MVSEGIQTSQTAPIEMTHDTSPSSAQPNVLQRLADALSDTMDSQAPYRIGGIISEVMPTHFRVEGMSRFLKIGDCVEIDAPYGEEIGEIVRVDARSASVKSLQQKISTRIGDAAWKRGPLTIRPAPSWKGRVVDALGCAIDNGPTLEQGPRSIPLDRAPPRPLHRQRIDSPLKTGIRVIDLFTPLCAGQRIGIFSGSGVGKSSLLTMLARSTEFDTVVVALVGERGREVREFLETAVAKNRQNTVAVVSTSDESSMKRRLAPKTAMTIAEYFRDAGDNVLLIVDSITRFAHAARDVGLASGEPPIARGYTPSVFSELPNLLERAGAGEEGSGSITGVFSVLVDGDDHNDPIADSIRGTIDGHIVLERSIAQQGRFPAVDVLSSVSRLAEKAWTPEQRTLIPKLRGLIARFEETREIRAIAGHRKGEDAELDQAVELVPRVLEALQQTPDDQASSDAFQELANALTPKRPEAPPKAR